MKKLKLMNHMGTGGLQSFKVNVTPSLLIMSQNAFLHDKKRQSVDNASNKVCACLCFLKDFAEASLSFTEPSQEK